MIIATDGDAIGREQIPEEIIGDGRPALGTSPRSFVEFKAEAEQIVVKALDPYQVQTAIAALHDEAARVEETDWPQILALYAVLEWMSSSPMVTLNRIIAVGMVYGPKQGLELLDRLETDSRIAGHYRLAAVRAHLLERAGDLERAIAHYTLAAGKTLNIAERSYLTMKAVRVASAVRS